MGLLRIACIGDVVGTPGCIMFKKYSSILKNEYELDGLIVNGENSYKNGRGITPTLVRFFRESGADVVTSGNHIWARSEIADYVQNHNDLLRPDNFPSGVPGTGVSTFTCGNHVIGVLNLQGRTFMNEQLSCPFRAADTALTYLKTRTNTVIVDFHAETTSETVGMGWYLDGRVSAVVGTHTHIPTADERVLPQGTAYVTDLGMTGAQNSMLGMKKGPILKRFLTQMPQRFSVEDQGPGMITGVVIEIDTNSGHAVAIKRISIVDDTIALDGPMPYGG